MITTLAIILATYLIFKVGVRVLDRLADSNIDPLLED